MQRSWLCELNSEGIALPHNAYIFSISIVFHIVISLPITSLVMMSGVRAPPHAAGLRQCNPGVCCIIKW